jgi:hypothetical protein
LDEKPVGFISSYLSSTEPDVPPRDLASNKDICTKGVVHYGEAFYIIPQLDEPPDGVGSEDWSEFLDNHSRWAVGGDQLNNLLRFDEWRKLIDLNQFPSEGALKEAGIFEIAEGRLKRQRQNLGEVSGAERLRKYWWCYQFAPLIALDNAPKLGLACLTKHLSWRIIPADVIPTEQVIILRFKSHAQFSTLQSRPHEIWARFFASTLEDRLRYTPSDCFETFPFPQGFETSPALEAAGRAYHDHRAALMIARNEGMTKTYNRFHDPDEQSEDIVTLRNLHAEMDRAVLRAYASGATTEAEKRAWDDLARQAEPVFLERPADENGKGYRPGEPEDDHTYQGRLFWPSAFRDEVLARLLALNASRHAEEVRLGIAPGMKGEAEEREENEDEAESEAAK